VPILAHEVIYPVYTHNLIWIALHNPVATSYKPLPLVYRAGKHFVCQVAEDTNLLTRSEKALDGLLLI
jgi:hypothetical protein